MHQRFIASAASVAICLAALTGCSQAYTGPSTTQEREIETVSVVELDTSGELNVVTGDHAALTGTAGGWRTCPFSSPCWGSAPPPWRPAGSSAERCHRPARGGVSQGLVA